MSAGKHNIIIDQGADFSEQFTLSEDGTPTDLTGYSARAQLRQKKSSTSVAETFICVITDAAGGSLNMAMMNSSTKNLTAGRYYYDLELYSASDVSVIRLLEGAATITAEVTR